MSSDKAITGCLYVIIGLVILAGSFIIAGILFGGSAVTRWLESL